ncbi:MAG TPA: potassium channel family protein [Burkholderiaceae bacterium]|nr:potassium channel family protein [Burkholderiaceae bacterium]
MHLVVPACVLLVIATTVLHYEILGQLNARLPRLPVPHRLKLLVVIFSAFVAHALEIAFYGLVLFGLVHWLDVGQLVGTAGFSLASCLYFSAETYTSLGFGDLTPVGPIRLLAGVEALNGLLLIGWSASFTYIAMERFWDDQREARDSAPN